MRLNEIVAVHATGQKQVYEICVGGKKLLATAEHRFLSPTRGWVQLHDLFIGEEIYVEVPPGGRANPRSKNTTVTIQGMWNHPFAVKFKASSGETRGVVALHRLVAEARLNKITVAELIGRVVLRQIEGLQFLDPERWDVHHADHDHANNAPENLTVLSRAEHSGQHGREGNWRSVTARTEAQPITQISAHGYEDTYDLTMADPLNNYVANGIVVHNSGKSRVSIAATVLTASLPALILCPSIAKWVWADEIAKWTGEAALLLEGRNATEARIFCVACRGSAIAPGGRPCLACRSLNGQALGYRLAEGTESVQIALRSAKWIVANYDVMVAQGVRDGGGIEKTRADLPGWAPTLAQIQLRCLHLDEAHLLRGRSTSLRAQSGQSRQDRITALAEPIERVYAITGTPIYGRVAHLYPILHCISGGLFTYPGGAFHSFDVRYTGAHKGEYGWVNSGRTAYADTELKERLGLLMLKRPHAEIFKDMPPVQRQVIRIEVNEAKVRARARELGSEEPEDGSDKLKADITRRLAAAFEAKLPTILEHVIAELMESPNVADIDEQNPPRKLFLVARLRRNAKALTEALVAALEKRDTVTRTREINLQTWSVHRDVDQQGRFNMAAAFRAHRGAGLFIATMDSVPGAISLMGAQTVGFTELHYSPAAMLQVEKRPQEEGTKGLTVLYFVAKGTADDQVEAAVLPKMETLDKMMNEAAAVEIQGSFSAGLVKESCDEIWDRLTRHAEDR